LLYAFEDFEDKKRKTICDFAPVEPHLRIRPLPKMGTRLKLGWVSSASRNV